MISPAVVPARNENTPMNEVTTYYLEMTSRAALRSKSESRGLKIRECIIKQYPLNRFLYQFIGAPWKWTDRLVWTDQQWEGYAENENLRTWVAYLGGTPAGYYELQKQEDGNVEVVLFGLASRFFGMGLGGYFLSQALESAWSWEGTKRVWLHTCTYDHAHALQNYTARGMTLYHEDAH